jgi:hypothetical protein
LTCSRCGLKAEAHESGMCDSCETQDRYDAAAEASEVYEVQVHRNRGMDESFEATGLTEANRLAATELTDYDTRRVVVIGSDGRVIDEWNR